MINRFTALAHEWLPQPIVRLITLLRGNSFRFEGGFATWQEASAKCNGYDADDIIAKVLDATLKVKRGEAVFERDSVLFDHIEYSWSVLSGLMWAAARNGGRLNVLDFGGSLGSSYFQNLKFLASLPFVRWNVVEQEHYVIAGQNYIQDDQLRFYKTIEECLCENKPDVVLLSSVLQYLPDPYGLIKELFNIQSNTIILDRTCYLNHSDKELIQIQHSPKCIYSAAYPIHFFIEKKLETIFNERGYILLEKFESLDKLDPKASWKGHIFTMKHT